MAGQPIEIALKIGILLFDRAFLSFSLPLPPAHKKGALRAPYKSTIAKAAVDYNFMEHYKSGK